MSEYRDSLPDEETRARFDAAINAAAEFHVAACYEEDLLVATKDPRALAEAAYYPGHPLGSVEAIEARIIEFLERARRERAA